MTTLLLAFARPWWLLALLPLGWLLWQLWRAPHAAASAWTRLVDAHLLPHLLTDAAPGFRRTALAIAAAGFVLAVLALAGPTRVGQSEQAYHRHALRVLVIDLSPQGVAQLDRIKAKAAALLRALPEGETALLVYADEPYLVVPPTTDAGIIARFIPELAADAVPVPGDRPERAFRMASALFARNSDSGAIVSDVIWIGAEPSTPVRASADLGNVRLLLLHAGERNDPALSETVQRRGGEMLRMQDDDGDVRRLVESLARDDGWLPDSAAASGRDDIGYWLLPLILPLAMLAFRRGVLMLLATVLCAGLLAPPTAQAMNLADFVASRLLSSGKAEAAATYFSDPHWRAIAHYRAGRYEEAARLLEGNRDPDALYNRGNALARQGRLLDALTAYEAALALRPADADTVHNRDLVRRLLNQQNRQGGKQNPPPQQQALRDADRVAEQWLRGVPDEPQSLLRRKLALEHQLRATGKVERPW